MGSGACALVYQTAWFGELKLVFGASTLATGAVLAIFMGGLGVGSARFGRRADAHPRPLRFYANLELTVALFAAASPLFLAAVRALYLAVGGSSTLGGFGATVVRLLLSTVVLAVPTLAMGGTLPAAVRAVETDDDPDRRAVSLLYGANALGAVLGVILPTFFLFEALGTRVTLWLACAVNVAIALWARALDREFAAAPRDKRGRVKTAEPPRAQVAQVAAAPRLFVLGACAVVGFVFFMMELVWYRMLTPLLGGSTYSFGLILATALAGIGLGGAAASAARLRRRPPSLSAFALTCAAEAALLGLPYALGDRLAFLSLSLRTPAPDSLGGLVLGWIVVTGLVVLPAAFVSGVQFPLLAALLGQGRTQVGRDLGAAYAANTAGSVAGALAGGFGLLPLLGAPGAWCLAVGLLVALGLFAGGLHWRMGLAWRPLGAPAAATAVALWFLAAAGPSAVWRHSSIGAGRAEVRLDSPNEKRAWIHAVRRNIVWEKDGVESSVGLSTSDGVAFYVNGRNDGNAVSDAPTQVMLGLLPALFHPQPKLGFVVGLGTGSTAGWMASVDGMERVDVAELEPAMLEVARQSAAVNQNILAHPKVRVLWGDGRELLMTARDRYDLIASEPSNPFRAGVSSFYTREFYAAVREHLSDGGVFAQWLQAYEVDEATIRAVIATLRAEFKAVEMWTLKPNDLVLVASEKPLVHDVAALRERIATEPFKTALAQTWYATRVEGLFAHFIANPAFAESAARAQGPHLNRDHHNFVEYAFARRVGQPSVVSVVRLLNEASAAGAARPVVQGELDWQAVAEERVTMLLSASPPQAGRVEGEPPGALARRTFLSLYGEADVAGAAAAFAAAPWEPRNPYEAAALAHVLSEADHVRAPHDVERLRQERPAESALLVARTHLRAQRLAEAAAAYESAFATLRAMPWPLPAVVQHALITLPHATLDLDFTRRMYAALELPFAARALDHSRQESRLLLSEVFDFRGRCVEALGPMEPYVPWTAAFLTFRARCYEAAGSAWVDRARRDLVEFGRLAAVVPQ